MAANSAEKDVAARFRWDKGDEVQNLIKCLASYKDACMHERKIFNAEKPKMYECLREDMTRIYQDKPSYFRLVDIIANPLYVLFTNAYEKTKRAIFFISRGAILKIFPVQSCGFQP